MESDSKSSEAMKQAHWNEQCVCAPLQPTHTVPNQFGQSSSVQLQSAPQRQYQSTPQRYLHDTANTAPRPKNPVHRPEAYPLMYQRKTYHGYGAVQISSALYVPNEMKLSIFTTFFCCLCLGIPAMIYSSEANGLKHVDPYRAISKAKTARILNVWAMIIGFNSIAIAAYFATCHVDL